MSMKKFNYDILIHNLRYLATEFQDCFIDAQPNKAISILIFQLISHFFIRCTNVISSDKQLVVYTLVDTIIKF